MRGVLRRDAECAWESFGAQFAESQDADPGDAETVDEVHTEPRRKLSLEDVRIHPVVDKESSIDRAVDHRKCVHPFPLLTGALFRWWRMTTCSGHTLDKKLPTEIASRSSTSE